MFYVKLRAEVELQRLFDYSKYLFIFAVAMSLVECWLSRKEKRKINFRFLQSDYIIFLSEKILFGLVVFKGFDQFALFENFRFFQFEDGGATVVILLIAYDAFFYFEHFLMHRFRFFWAIHYVHHSGEFFGISLGFRLSWFRHLRRLFFAIPMYILGFPTMSIFLSMLILNYYALFVHSATKIKFPRFVGFLMSPYLHSIHHEKQNTEGFNLGGMTTVWDFIFGTYKDSTTLNPEYGIEGYRFTFNPMANQFKSIISYLFNKK